MPAILCLGKELGLATEVLILREDEEKEEPTLHRGYGIPNCAASRGPKYFFHSCMNEIADQFVIISLLWCVYLTPEKDVINGKLTHWPIEMRSHSIRYDN